MVSCSLLPCVRFLPFDKPFSFSVSCFCFFSFPSPWLGSIVEFAPPSATSANQRSVSRTCLKYALTHQEKKGSPSPPTHPPPPQLRIWRPLLKSLPAAETVGRITARSDAQHPPRNDIIFIFNINCSNPRVTMATTTLGITDATLSNIEQNHSTVYECEWMWEWDGKWDGGC